MRYLYYFIRSVCYRGLLNTLNLLRYEWKGDKRYGINTQAVVNTSKNNGNYHYQGASYLAVEQLFQKLYRQYPNYMVYDIGCGKGRVLFVAERFGFTDLKGIDLDAALIEVARLNLQNYVRQNAKAQFQFVEQNALQLEIPDAPCIYFLFNPFSDDVLRPLLHRIKANASKPCVFVYMNPRFEICFQEMGFQLKETLYTKRYKEAVIYTHQL